MNFTKLRFGYLLLVLLSQVFNLLGQDVVEFKDISIQNIEKQVLGADDLLLNGSIYQVLHPRVAGHPYFKEADWQPGIVYIKGKAFEVEQMVFDLEINALVANQLIVKRGLASILLNPNLVDSFRMASRCFVNLQVLDKNLDPIFYEHLYTGNYTFLMQHKKVFIARYTSNQPHGKYSQMESTPFVYGKGELANLKKEKAVLRFFADQKEKVKQYLEEQDLYYPNASSEELLQLLKFCDGNTM